MRVGFSPAMPNRRVQFGNAKFDLKTLQTQPVSSNQPPCQPWETKKLSGNLPKLWAKFQAKAIPDAKYRVGIIVSDPSVFKALQQADPKLGFSFVHPSTDTIGGVTIMLSDLPNLASQQGIERLSSAARIK